MTEPIGHVHVPGLPPEPEQDPATLRTYDRAVVRGIAWSAGAKWVTQLASWIATFAVAKLIGPASYGLVGMAALYFGLISVVSEFGIGAAIVTLRDLSDDEIAQLNTLSVAIGVGIGILSCGMAYPLALFFRTPALVPVVLALSVSFVITAFRSVPNALLQRDLRFRDLALVDGVRGLIVAALSVALAMAGFQHWTLVLSEIVGISILTGLTMVLRGHRFAIPRFASIRRAVSLSHRLLVGRISWYVYSNADFLVAGRVLGQAALGAYEFAWSITNIPVEKVTSLLAGVTPAVFSAVQDDAAALKRYVLALTEVIAMVAFPAATGIALVAGDLVPIVLGPEWNAAIAPLQLLALYTGIRSIMPLIPNVLVVKGKARMLMFHGIACAVVFPVGFFIGSRYGTAGIAGAWAVLYPLSIIPLLYVTFKLVTPAKEYFAALVPATTATVLMACAVAAVGAFLPSTLPVLTRIAGQIATGALVYVIVVLVLFPHRLRLFRQTIAAMR